MGMEFTAPEYWTLLISEYLDQKTFKIKFDKLIIKDSFFWFYNDGFCILVIPADRVDLLRPTTGTEFATLAEISDLKNIYSEIE